MPCVAEVVNRSLKADCTDFNSYISSQMKLKHGTGDNNSESVNLLLPEPMILHFFLYLYTSFPIFSKMFIFLNSKTTL